ncbi:hypothetical protein FIV42_21325 [Persicimonas caeni]|uniref:Uncharacterized protein n=1 Tax=Persicimonas caeni TaxID=2292766 RepID=A0A4Y6PY68_PERCE|nr:hypothetical protein [Persicimonas caeni]QDG53193.1 hypothetical protein FIV42_21325 [Persicimonas caeni]QED34415.1 hypothetical protein FRD00_21320 [Persicimonas caeni]
MRRLGRSLKQQRGATATETIILVVLVAMVVLASIKVLRDNLGNKVDEANTHVSAVSIDREDPDEKRRRQKAKEMAQEGGEAGAGGSSEAGAKGQGSGGSQGGGAAVAGPDDEAGGSAVASADGQAAAPEGGCGGFNPFIIPIALGLMGLLGYVVMKTKKG